jgi:hypothetical protein
MRPAHEVADSIRLHGKDFLACNNAPVQVQKTFRAMEQCRTAALGGHISVCTDCGTEQISYNSCRNRHCPKCQSTNKEKWIMARESELLPVPYYHIVFTLPNCFNELLPKYSKQVYSSLCTASWQTIQTFAADPKYLGAKTGMVAILHTWGQQLWLHPHLHCIVPGGGITVSGKWKNCKYKAKYLYPKRAMSKIFRAKFMASLRGKIKIPQSIAKQAFKTNWVVYAKRPFATPKTVVEYLGRYTHKIAISNHRLMAVEKNTVSFQYTDYRDAAKQKIVTLQGLEFLRRFAQHILPWGFVRIRHYGFLASRNKKDELNLAKTDLNQPKWEKLVISWVEISVEKLGYDPNCCSHCKAKAMKILKSISPERGPPTYRFPNVQ